jgi:hypothetical protein
VGLDSNEDKAGVNPNPRLAATTIAQKARWPSWRLVFGFVDLICRKFDGGIIDWRICAMGCFFPLGNHLSNWRKCAIFQISLDSSVIHPQHISNRPLAQALWQFCGTG